MKTAGHTKSCDYKKSDFFRTVFYAVARRYSNPAEASSGHALAHHAIDGALSLRCFTSSKPR